MPVDVEDGQHYVMILSNIGSTTTLKVTFIVARIFLIIHNKVQIIINFIDKQIKDNKDCSGIRWRQQTEYA
jgi:hypothetical protein